MGATEWDPAEPESVMVAVNGPLIGDAARVLSTAAHELGHVIFDAPSWIRTGTEPVTASLATLNAVASRVMTAAEQGLVHPVQKKIGREDFLYFAVRASDRHAGSAAARIPLSRFARPVAATMPEAVAA